MSRLPGRVLRFVLYFLLAAPLVLFGMYAFSTRWFFPQPFPAEWTAVSFVRTINDSAPHHRIT